MLLNRRFVLKIFPLCLIVLLAACSLPEEAPENFKIENTSGSLTIKDIPAEYHGLWITGGFSGIYNNDLNRYEDPLRAYADIRSAGKIPVFYAGKIPESGEVKLKVWKVVTEPKEYRNYSGNDEGPYLSLSIVPEAIHHDFGKIDPSKITSQYYREVTFTNGTAVVSWPTE
jgi:hypothetical protein